MGDYEFLENFDSFHYDWKYWSGNEPEGYILQVDLGIFFEYFNSLGVNCQSTYKEITISL